MTEHPTEECNCLCHTGAGRCGVAPCCERAGEILEEVREAEEDRAILEAEVNRLEEEALKEARVAKAEKSLDRMMEDFGYNLPELSGEKGLLAWLDYLLFQALMRFLDFIAPSSRNPPAPSQHSRGRP